MFSLCLPVHGGWGGYPSHDKTVYPLLPTTLDSLPPAKTRTGYPPAPPCPCLIYAGREQGVLRQGTPHPIPLVRTRMAYPHPVSCDQNQDMVPPTLSPQQGPEQGTPPYPIHAIGRTCHRQDMARAVHLLHFHVGGLSCSFK